MKSIPIAGLVTETLRKRKLATLLVVANMVLPILYLTGVSPASVLGKLNPQNQKRVQTASGSDQEPIQVLDLKLQATPVVPGEPFDSSDADWIRDLRFKIRNRSNKPISFVHINILFPETRAMGPILVHQLFIGQRSDMMSTLVDNLPLELMPGKESDVSLDHAYARIKRLIEHRTKVVDIHDIKFVVDEVMFTDGTLWSAGTIWKRNPDTSSPHKWLPVDPARR